MFDRVLVPLDGSSLAEGVLPHLVAVAGAYQSSVLLLHVLERSQTSGRLAPIDPLAWHIGKAEARAYLDDVADRLRGAGLTVETSLLEGRAARTIVELAAEREVGLVFLSSHGRSGLSGWNVSSVAQQVILRVRRSVMLVRAYQPAVAELTDVHYERILVPLDGSQRAETVLSVVTALARSNQSQVLAVHVVRRPELLSREPLGPEDAGLAEQIVQRNSREAAAYLDQLKTRLPIELDTRVVYADNPAVALHDIVDQESMDLVIVSAHGQSGAARFPYGSLVTGFIAYGSTPLLIVQDLSPQELQPTQAEVLASEFKGH